MKERLLNRARFLKSSLRAGIQRRLLGPHAIAIIAETRDGLFALSPEDVGVGAELTHNASYGLDELDLLAPYLQAPSRVLIVGAHIGALTVPIARRVQSVCAIEANPETFRLLQLNVLLNRLDNVHLENIAASNRTETISFLMSRANSGGSKRTPLKPAYAYYYDKPKEVQVPAHALDEFLEQEFDVVVMDIEGSEYFALQGSQRILGGAKLLQIEFLPHHFRNVSGATIPQFLDLVTPHFPYLFIPSKNLALGTCDFEPALSRMFAADEGDAGILFTKEPLSR